MLHAVVEILAGDFNDAPNLLVVFQVPEIVQRGHPHVERLLCLHDPFEHRERFLAIAHLVKAERRVELRVHVFCVQAATEELLPLLVVLVLSVFAARQERTSQGDALLRELLEERKRFLLFAPLVEQDGRLDLHGQ